MTKLVLKRLIGRAAHLTAPVLQDRVAPRRLVLLYHAIGDGAWGVPERQFASQMWWLREHSRFVSLDDILARQFDDPLQVAVTFDDGYASVHGAAAPVLHAVGAVATVYLNTGRIGMNSRSLSDPALGYYPGQQFLLWPEAAELAAAGWVIGSHGVDHLDLTREPGAIARAQLSDSKSMIEDKCGRACVHFSYTWGRHSEELRRWVAEAGYRHAAAARHGPLRADDPPLALPRVNIAHEYTMSDFQAIVRGDWDYLGRLQQLRTSWP